MKIRSDYVSNSSSSSFVVVLPKDYAFWDFVDDVVRACTSEQDGDYSEDDIEYINNSNRRNLDYCLTEYALLFLGELKVGTMQDKYTKMEREAVLKMINRSHDDIYCPVVVSDEDGILVTETGEFASEVTIRKELMRWRIRPPNEDFSDAAPEKVARNILDCCRMKEMDSFSIDNSCGLCEITMDTIKNTEDLISNGNFIQLDRWMDLDKMKKRIEDGDRIFCITMSQGGDGQDSHTIFATNGWDSDMNKYANVEVLHVECC